MTKTQNIRDVVEAELSHDPLVDAASITVKNMNGEVALNGTVPSYPQYLEAAAAARRVAGVTNVYNHLKVVLPAGDYRDDGALTMTVSDALTLNVTIPDTVSATARNGNVTLTGRVGYGVQRQAAEDTIAALTGVRNIKNEIVISADADPVDVTVHVQDALDRYALIPDDSDVTVDARGNTVTLAGHVRTWAEHDAIVDAAWRSIGVQKVLDNLHITG
jgi:osmotically-inducible protein OsmY